MSMPDSFNATFAALRRAAAGLEKAVRSGPWLVRGDTRIVEALMQTLRALIARVLGLPPTSETAETLDHIIGACVMQGIAIATVPDDVWHELTAEAETALRAYDAKYGKDGNAPTTVDILTCEDIPQSVRDTIRDILARDGGEL